MEGQANILTAPYILGAIITVIFLILGADKLGLFTKKKDDPFNEPDLSKLNRPRRTGNYKFVEENPDKFVLYCEFEVWEMQEFITGFKRVFWERATEEDLNAYYDQRMLKKNGRI